MRSVVLGFLVLGALLGCGSSEKDAGTQAVPEANLRWPKLFELGGDRVVMYDPQVDDWKNYDVLSVKCAVAVTPQDAKQSSYGIIEFQTRTVIDHEDRQVLLGARILRSLRFPGASKELAPRLEEIVRRVVPTAQTLRIPLDFLVAEVKKDAPKDPATAASVKVNLDPPPIYAAEAPAILMIFTGPPQFKAVEGTTLEFATNTNWDLFRHPGTESYFLLNGEGWLTTKKIAEGPWTSTEALPAELSSLPANDNWSEVRKNIPGKKIDVPKVTVTERPAELIVTEGPAAYEAIPGTTLLYCTNTTSNLFRNSADGLEYFLAAGRWFRAKSLQGPWTSAMADLPKEFANIPPDHVKAAVRVSVAGTQESKDAVLLAEIPRRATVSRKDVTLSVNYEGEPKFELIEGTKVSYAVNSPYSIFLVGNRYYCCHDGVWFESPGGTAGWIVCDKIPPEIYTIPSTHPKYNVTYVTVYESTDDVVVVGYTAGYTGVYVTAGVVVYGCGWYMGYYPPYWYYHYNPWYWGYGCGAYYHYGYGGYYRGGYAYGPYGGVGFATAYNPVTGTYARGAYAYGPYGSRYAASSYNPYTNTYKARTGGQTPYGQWERGVARQGSDWVKGGYVQGAGGTVGGIRTSEGGAFVGSSTGPGEGSFVGRNQHGDIYAGRDGNVYRKQDGEWSKFENGEWTNPDRPSQRPSAGTSDVKPGGERPTTSDRSWSNSDTASNLNRDVQNRNEGWQNTDRASRSRSSFGGGRGGGRR